MPRQFDNETFHLDPNGSFLSRYRNCSSVAITMTIILLVFLVTLPFRSETSTDTRYGADAPSITKEDLGNFDPKGDLSRFTRQDLELIIHQLGNSENGPGTVTIGGKSYRTSSTGGEKGKKNPTDAHDSTQPTQPTLQQPPKPPQQQSTPKSTPTPTPTPQPTPVPDKQQPDQNKAKKGGKTGPNPTPSPNDPIPIPPLFEGHDIIVTLTTIPDRMPYLNATLLSLVSQTVPPTEIVLNIPYVSRRFFNSDGSPLSYDLPRDFIEYINALGSLDDESVRKSSLFPFEMPHLPRVPTITIHRCDDDGPATKLLPTLAREFAIGRMDSILIIADDDVIYPPNWTESLVGYYLSNPQLHYSALGARGYCSPPTNVWEWTIISQIAISGTQLMNITENLNHPYRENPLTLEIESHYGSPYSEDHRTMITPNAHRFIWRPQNYTRVIQEGGRPIQDYRFDAPEITTKVIVNPDWPFAYLFDDRHPSYKPNKWHKHPSTDIEGTLLDAQHFVENELQFSHLYEPIQKINFKTILPHIPHQQHLMSHTPVDIITGNNGFLLRPYYFLRYSPFIGNITRFEPQVLNAVSLEHYLNKNTDFEYSTQNSYFGKIKPALREEYLQLQEIIADKVEFLKEMRQQLTTKHNLKSEKETVGKAKEEVKGGEEGQAKDSPEEEESLAQIDMDPFWQVHGELSQFQIHLMNLIEQGADIRENAAIVQEVKMRRLLIKNDMLTPEQAKQPDPATKRLPSGKKATIPDMNLPGEPESHKHPELDSLTGTQYHMAHRKLHKKLDIIDELIYKFSQVFDLASRDAPLQHEVLTSPVSNIVQFGRFPDDMQTIGDEIRNDLDWSPPPTTTPFDFQEDTKSAPVPGSDLSKALPESVYYMDDIWFNGILAANDVSRVVTSLTVDPLHRPKMQESTTTLEQVPIGRSFHNNVLLKAFEQYWTNCPYVPANLTIPHFYLKYFTLGESSFEKRAQDAMNMLNKRNKKKKDGEATTAAESSSPAAGTQPKKWTPPAEDYRNLLSNPWLEWGVPDIETNVSTQYYIANKAALENMTSKIAPKIVNNDETSTSLSTGGKKLQDDDNNNSKPQIVDASNLNEFFETERNKNKKKAEHDP